MTFADTIQETAKEASARIAGSAKSVGGAAQGAAKVAGKKVSTGYGQALDLLLTGAKLIPTVSSALGLLGLQKKKSNVLGNSLSFSAGLALGAGAGMLFAPKSGSELRQTLLGYFSGTPLEQTAQEVAEKAQAAVHTVSQTMTDKVESLKSDVKPAAPNGGNRSVS